MKKPRFGYEIAGVFTTLPDFAERHLCLACRVEPFRRPPRRPSAPKARREDLEPHLQSAALLGERVAHYLRAYGGSDPQSAKTAAALYGELREGLLAWQAGRLAASKEASPWADNDLNQRAKVFPELLTFLSAFEMDGRLSQALVEAPLYTPRYLGSKEDLLAQATFLVETRREMSAGDVLALRTEIGAGRLEPAEIEARLLAADWCQDGAHYVPASAYYTGNLWPKYERAKARADAGDANALRQATKLYEAIGPSPLSEIGAEPRMPWVPLPILQAWLAGYTQGPVATLSRQGGLLRLEGQPLAAIEKLRPHLQQAFGYINHDYGLFQPDYEKQHLPELQRDETANEGLDRARLEYAARAIADFGQYLLTHPDAAREVELGYAAMFKGYVHPVYEPRDLEIARWRGSYTLRPHQRVGAWRLINLNGGLLAFDVGVGKTLTGIGVLARLRQEGRAKRIFVIVPNSIIWKWHKEILRALPDYRVLIIGSERYQGRDGIVRSRLDTPAERAIKYRQFQGGEFDVALVTFSMFARTGLRKETLGQFVAQNVTIQRELGLQARNEQVGAEKRAGRAVRQSATDKKLKRASIAQVRRLLGDEAIEEAKGEDLVRLQIEVATRLDREKDERQARLADILRRLQDASERERAIFSLKLEEWIADQLDVRNQDPGIFWEDLKIDLLILDEAQNFKNLWPVEQREGGIPKYLGAIQEGSQRAWQFALRSFEVRQRNSGGGVVLLSATPAKNSPLEYFTLLGYVDSEAWTRLGITDPEVFIDRYLRLEMRTVIEPDLTHKIRSVVAGFKNVTELSDVVFRFADFKTAEEVGLTLPPVEREQIFVQMSEMQRRKFGRLASAYRRALLRAKDDPAAKMAALGYFQRMALVSVHEELDTEIDTTVAGETSEEEERGEGHDPAK